MKKKILLGTILTSVMLGGSVLASTTGLYQGLPIVNVTVDGQTIKGDVPAINLNGRTMVPVRFVTEALGAGVEWDAKTQTAKIKNPARKLSETDMTKHHIEAMKFGSRITDHYRKLMEIQSATYTISNGFTLVANSLGSNKQSEELKKALDIILTMINEEKQTITKLKADSNPLVSDAQKKYGIDISDINTILSTYEDSLEDYSAAHKQLLDYLNSKNENNVKAHFTHLKSANEKSGAGYEASLERYQFHYKALQSY